jgi:predicted unusual protein kinase regulating ubiquinone biosynthesis (AarF/ABC1/UbiB family)
MKNNIFLDGLRSVARVGETAVIAARAGIKYATEKPSNAKLMRETFESLGSTYIKLGQFIASTPSLFPREYVEEFQGCLDQTPSLPFSYVQGVLASEFDNPIDLAYRPAQLVLALFFQQFERYSLHP